MANKEKIYQYSGSAENLCASISHHLENEERHVLAIKDFAKLFDTTVKDIPDACKEIIETNNFAYRKITGAIHE